MTAQELLDKLLQFQSLGRDLTQLEVVIAELKEAIFDDTYVERTPITEVGTDIFDTCLELRK